MSMLPAFDQMVDDAVAVAERTAPAMAPRRRWSTGSFLIAAAIALAAGGSAAAATLYALRGQVIPAPSVRDASPEQSALPGTTHVLPLRADDPGGGPKWAMSTARSRTGYVCSTVGQIDRGRFGLIGLDGVFRQIETGVVDSCGLRRVNAASLIGARVFDAAKPANVRTVVSGVAGDTLASVDLDAGGTTRELPVGPDGSFIKAIRGYPEDIGIHVRLRFRDGHVERHTFGTSAWVVTDPEGAGAWKVIGIGTNDRPNCAQFYPARPRADQIATSAAACGRLSGKINHLRGIFFAARRQTRTKSTRRPEPLAASWRFSPRTAVWGRTGEDVRAITVIAPDNSRRRLAISPGRTFLAVYPASVDPQLLRVEVTYTGGRQETLRGDHNLIP